MSSYRLYRLDGAGKIHNGDWVEAVDDDTAVREARLRIPEGGFELWHAQRLIRREPRGER